MNKLLNYHSGVCLAAIMAVSVSTEAMAAHSETNTWRSTQTNNRSRAGQFGDVETLNELIGRPIQSADNQKAGKIANFVMDLESGRILYVVVDPQGGLDNNIAVPPGIFENTRAQTLRLKVNRQALAGAPTWNLQPDQLGQAAYISQVYQKFGQPAWWQGSTPADQGSFKNVHSAKQLVKMNVVNVQNHELGKVRTAALDLSAGRVLFVILNPDNSLNLGNRLFAVPPNVLTLSPDHQRLVSDLTREKLASAPHFQTGREWPIDNRSFAAQVYQHFGKQAYFQTGTALQPTGRSEEQIYSAPDTNGWYNNSEDQRGSRRDRDRWNDRDSNRSTPDRDRDFEPGWDRD